MEKDKKMCIRDRVGLTGVAGFLLPIVYTGLLQMSVTQGRALSFAAFILSGALGSFNYKKAGNLDVSFGLRLSAGSMAGAVLGVKDVYKRQVFTVGFTNDGASPLKEHCGCIIEVPDDNPLDDRNMKPTLFFSKIMTMIELLVYEYYQVSLG